MAKSKKSKKADFQKVKLKVGRRLPKDTNVTDIRFKAKKISLPGQTKEYVGEAGQKSKYDLAELTKGLEGSKKSSILIPNLEKIKKLLSEDAGESGSLTQILDALRKTSFLLVSQEPRVRKAALSVIKEVFASVSEQQMSSFFPQLRTSISRATTHLDSGVRNDSLVFLELVLEHYPKVLCDSYKSLKIFLDLISHKAIFSSSAKSCRMLFSNPDERITAQQWRFKVLGIFVKYLDAYNAVARGKADENLENPLGVFDREKHAFVVHEHGLKTSLLKFSIRKSERNILGTNAADVQKTFIQFLYLLINIWKEEVPSLKYSTAIHDSWYQAPKNMMIVLRIICKLIELANLMIRGSFHPNFLQEVKESFAIEIESDLLPYFPVYWSQFSSHHNESFVLSVNIAFCEVFASIVLGTKVCSPKYQKMFVDYVLEALGSVDPGEKNFASLITILKTFLLDDSFSDKENLQLDSVLTVYGARNQKGYLAAQNFFLELVMDPNNMMLNNGTVQYWLRYLPEEFINMSQQGHLNDSYLSVVQKVASRGFSTFIRALEENFSSLVSILGMSDEKGQQFVASLIASIENFTLDDFIQLAHAFRDPSVSINTIRHIVVVLNQRANNEQSAFKWKEQYLGFLFNIALGVFEGEMEIARKEEEVIGILTSNIELQMTEFQLVPFQDLARHGEVLQVAISAMQSLAERASVKNCLQIFLTAYINSVQAEFMPVNVAVAVLEIVTQLLSGKPTVEDLVYYITDFTVELYVYQHALDSSPALSDAERAKYSISRFLPGRNAPKLRVDAIRAISKYVRKADRIHLEYIGRVLITILDTFPIGYEECKAVQTVLHRMDTRFGDDYHNEMWCIALEERLM